MLEFQQDGLCWISQKQGKQQVFEYTNKTQFFSITQVFSEVGILHHISIAICQHDVKIWTSHLDVISMEIPINSDGSIG